ncbi:MAG: CobW family GTP-binding protein [Pseudomonadales bacterium]|jgi:G3E family GTPase|nr:CobW family GTP-binding protein [Pseudomonadales bacterium]
MIPFTVIGGYLGAGKTTLLNHILRAAGGRRIALLINDFGDINIDAMLIESHQGNRINLTNGCICCSLSDGFYGAIATLMTEAPLPDHIVVEASGVADVHTLAQYGHSPDLQLDGVIVLADLETVQAKIRDKYVGQTIRRQLAAADVIVANKTDLLTQAHCAVASNWLQGEFPQALVHTAEQGNVPLALLLGIHTLDKNLLEHSGHAHFCRWSYSSPRLVAADSLRHFLTALDDSVIRLKGTAEQTTVNLVAQVVGRRRELRPQQDLQAQGLNLVAIGLEGQLNTRELDRLANRLLKFTD